MLYVAAPASALTADRLLDAQRYPALPTLAEAHAAAQLSGWQTYAVQDAGGGWWRVLTSGGTELGAAARAGATDAERAQQRADYLDALDRLESPDAR